MDFDKAIKAHVFWKVTLRWMINGQHPLDEALVGADDQCELGRWIYADGAKYRELPGFAALIEEHAEFHRIAGAVVSRIHEDHSAEAEAMLAPEGAFTIASARTIAAIRALREQLEAG